MNAKLFITILTMICSFATGRVRCQETADSLTHRLQEVVVTAKHPATKLVGSTLVSTIHGSNLADIGTALDVLAQLPMITVDGSDVNVTGKSDVEVYIDGRPMLDPMALQQILSSNLRKVELLMAPGAAYKSTVGAVLKITTKRNFVQGLSITDRFVSQRRRKWSVTDYLGLNHRTGNLDIFLDATFSHNNSLVKSTTTNTLVYDGRPTVVGSSRQNSFPVTKGELKAGFNYVMGEQSFGAYYRYSPEQSDLTNSGEEWVDEDPRLPREIKKRSRAHTHLASIYYENLFADKYLLHFDGDFRYSIDRNRAATAYPQSDISDVNSTERRNSTLWAGKLCLDFPLFSGNFTVGTQDSYTHTMLDYRMLNSQVAQYIPSSQSDATQTSAALFASWSRMFDKFSLSAGLRYEYVDYNFMLNGRRDEDVSRSDHMLTPDLSMGYFFNDAAQITLSYKMATVKPPYSQLTGSLTYVGLHETEGGNPALRDEKVHDINFFGMWNGFWLQADYIRSRDTYAYVKELYASSGLHLLMHPVNIDLSALSVYLSWSMPINFWTPNVTLGMYRQWLTISSSTYNRPLCSYFFDNTFALPGGWTLTANMNGQLQGDMHTNRFSTTWFTMDASVGKTFVDKALTVKLSATDIFNSANHDWSMNTYGIFVDKRQSYDRRGISLDIIYKFQPRKSKYKGSAASQEELDRL